MAINDHTMVAATGKTWAQWKTILDQAQATMLSHTEIARYLYLHYLENNGWWCQMLANRYEQENGLRRESPEAAGFEVSARKTLSVSLTDLYAAWISEPSRNTWLKEKNLEITKVTPNVSIRLLWSDQRTHVRINFYEKNSGKNQVVVDHMKLADKKIALQQKAYWKEKLNDLKNFLETSI